MIDILSESVPTTLVGHEVLPEEVHALAQGGMIRFAQVGIALPELHCKGAGKFDQWSVTQVGDAQFRHAALANTEEVTRAAQAQVLCGKAKTVIRRLEYFQALLGVKAGIGAEHVTE